MYAQAAARGATAASAMAAVAGGGPGDSENDVEVRKEDQDLINEFGTLNSRFHELEEDLKALQVCVGVCVWGGGGGGGSVDGEGCANE